MWNTTTRSGMRLMLNLGQSGDDVPKSARRLAEDCALPEAFAASILRRLVHAGALLSHRGARGGFLLARPASETSWADMVGVVHGPMSWTPCIAGANRVCQHCPNDGACALRAMAQRLHQADMRELRAVRLNDPFAAP